VNEAEVAALFANLDILKRGHFRLSSGRHSDTYLQCALALQYPAVALRLGRALAERILTAGHRPDVVASPALGGVLAGFAVAAALDRRFVFAERAPAATATEPRPMLLRRGQRLEPGEHVVVVEDVITTGGSAGEVAELCRQAGASVDAIAALVDRSGEDLASEIIALLRVTAASWAPEECRLCAAGLAVERPGSRQPTGD
jgi:orotate phosphoribosyltransferase